MKSFTIIPVLDILNSRAVHAIKGERTKYKPLKSYLFQSPNPLEIINTLKDDLKFKMFYIADLDSIIRKKPNYQLLEELLTMHEINFMLDPGIVDLQDITQFSGFTIKNLILGLETIKNFDTIVQSLEIFDKNNIIISVDMYKGKILSNANDIKSQNPIKLTKDLESIGLSKLILLDLFRVGQKIGGIPPLYFEILQNFSGDIFVGGGIKNYSDLLNFKKHNFSGVLIATALYDGTIDIEKIK